jgi:hypothetical protein
MSVMTASQAARLLNTSFEWRKELVQTGAVVPFEGGVAHDVGVELGFALVITQLDPDQMLPGFLLDAVLIATLRPVRWPVDEPSRNMGALLALLNSLLKRTELPDDVRGDVLAYADLSEAIERFAAPDPVGPPAAEPAARAESAA